MILPNGYMMWYAPNDNETKQLYVKQSGRPWVHWFQLPSAFKQPDHNIPNGTPGYATMQYLLKAKYIILPSQSVLPSDIEIERYLCNLIEQS